MIVVLVGSYCGNLGCLFFSITHFFLFKKAPQSAVGRPGMGGINPGLALAGLRKTDFSKSEASFLGFLSLLVFFLNSFDSLFGFLS